MKQSTLEHELAIEQAHVDLVYARLEEATRSAQQVATEGANLYRSDRGRFVREEDGTGLYERDVFAYQAAKRLATLDAEHEGLVFGRLDRTDGEVRYVGRIGVRDADYEPLVIDWRARAAEPFYRATPVNPMDVVRRRVLRCAGDRVIGIEDDLLDDHPDSDIVVVGEGALMAALTRARGPQMRDIVATIQSEQDEAIRAPWQGFTMISGGPGTGKTVVALHRAAFLLYSHRRRFENGGVLVVGPSQLFMNYIERVLPSLGEDAVTLRSIGTVASDVVDIRGERTDNAVVATIKGSLRMAAVLKRLVNEPWQDVPQELFVTLKGHVLRLDSPELARIRADVLAHNKLNAGREPAERALLTALWRKRPEELDVEREDFDERVTDSPAFAVFTNAWWPRVSATDALARLASGSLTARLSAGVLTAEEAEQLSATYRGRRGANDWTIADAALLDELVLRLGPLPELEDREVSLFLDDEDASVSQLVTTMERLEPRRETDPFATPHDTFAHILVDEAQDITPMQWRMLRRRGPSASWTVVGDPAQSSWPDPPETERALAELVGSAPVRRFRMSTNYRSPAEVFDLAAQVVVPAYPQADLPKAVRSTGVLPELRITDQLGSGVRAGVADLLAAVEGTVGVVAPPSLVVEVRRALDGSDQDASDQRGGDGQASARGASDQHANDRHPYDQHANDRHRDERVVVVTALQAKGLEYDGVLVVDPDAIVAESAGGLRSLYVALTRPTQRLITLDLGPDPAWRKNLS